MKPARRIDDLLAALVVAAYAATALAWSIATPIFEAPDEPGHIDYVARLILQKTLPEQDLVQRNYAHHPPLYYAAAAAASAFADWRDERDMPVWRGSGHGAALARHSPAEQLPWRGRVAAVHIARLVSIAFGATAVTFTIAAGRLTFPGKPSIGLTAGALLAWTPQFTFITSAVNNDAAAAAAGAVLLWGILRARQQPGYRRRWLLLGVECGAALLTKATTVSLVGAAAAVWAAEGMRRSDRRAWLIDGAVLFGSMAAISGWWFLRNIELYGDPFGWTAYRQAWASMMRTAAPSLSELAETADIAWRSYWGWFGWLTLDAGDWLHIGANLLLGAAAYGAWVQRRYLLAQRIWHPGVVVCAAVIGLHLAHLIVQNVLQTVVMAQGRHFFPAAGAAMLLTASGLCAGDDRRGAWAAAAMTAANVVCLFAVVAPAYS